MNHLDFLSGFIEESKRKFEDTVRRHVNGIDLGDVLKKLEGRTPAERENYGWFIFDIHPYKVRVSNKKINVFGYDNLVDKEFRGKEVEDFYHRLVGLMKYTKM